MGVFKEALVRGKDILNYIPQRPPIIMVDELFYISQDSLESVSGLTIREDNIFCKDGVFCEGGLVEFIAQSAALRIGYIFISRGASVPLGFIGSINDMNIEYLPEVGEHLICNLKVEQEVFGIVLVRADIFSNEIKVGSCKMKVAIKE